MAKKNRSWGGRFKQETAKNALEFSNSIEIDKTFYREDIEGSIAYAEALVKAKILKQSEFKKIKMISKGIGSIAAGISGSGPSIFSLSNKRVTSNNILDKISDHYNSMDIDFDGFISKVNSGGIKIIESK